MNWIGCRKSHINIQFNTSKDYSKRKRKYKIGFVSFSEKHSFDFNRVLHACLFNAPNLLHQFPFAQINSSNCFCNKKRRSDEQKKKLNKTYATKDKWYSRKKGHRQKRNRTNKIIQRKKKKCICKQFLVNVSLSAIVLTCTNEDVYWEENCHSFVTHICCRFLFTRHFVNSYRRDKEQKDREKIEHIFFNIPCVYFHSAWCSC